jgi:hypothetical protein
LENDPKLKGTNGTDHKEGGPFCAVGLGIQHDRTAAVSDRLYSKGRTRL